MTTELDLARNEIKELNKQLYTEYKKVKVLKEQVDYLKEKLSITEVELEKLSERKLNGQCCSCVL
jgi:peptidoglycan hydrolase CwlO-like protein